MSGSIITVGINLITQGFDKAANQLKQFGNVFQGVEKEAKSFANGYDNVSKQVIKSNQSLSKSLKQDWGKQFDSLMNTKKFQGNSEKALDQLALQYDRQFREIGNKYQSMVMGSVALSMSGVGIKNFGSNLLGSLKVPLDAAKDWELIMKQIQFYGHLTNDQLQQSEDYMMKLGRDLPVTSTDIANGVMEAFKLGYDKIGDAQQMSKEASKITFMSLGKLDGGESMKYLNQFRQLSGYSVGDTGKLTDKLAKTADLSAASIDSLWKTIQSSRSAMDNLHLDADNMLTISAVMSNRLTPRNAGMALSSFAGGVQMAEKSGREVAEGKQKGSRGKYYNQLKEAMGGKGFDDFHGDVLGYIEQVAQKSKEVWGDGSQRTGILISMFGKSALDLFHAYDSFNQTSGTTMTAMRDAIKDSAGYSDKYMDTIMNTSYGTEELLNSVAEQFNILFGKTLRPGFNEILKGIASVIGKVNEFIQAHPKLAQVLGYGIGLAGLLSVATGALMIFGGALLAIYASLNNFVIQLARNNNVINMLNQGYRTAGAMIRGQVLGPLRLLGSMFLKTAALSFFLYMAWKHDFLRMRTSFYEWKSAVSAGLLQSQRLFQTFSSGTTEQFTQTWAHLERTGQFDTLQGRIAKFVTKARMTWAGLKEIFKKREVYDPNRGVQGLTIKDGIIPPDMKKKLDEAGVTKYVKAIFNAFDIVRKAWKGFIRGFGDGIEVFWDWVKPLRTAFSWLRDEFIKIAQHFGYFKHLQGEVSNKWEAWGEKLGVILGIAVGIRLALWAWGSGIRAILAPLKLAKGILSFIWAIMKKIGGTGIFGNIGKAFKKSEGNMLARIFKGLGVGFAKTIADALMKFLPKPLRTLVGGALAGGKRVRERARDGAHTRIKNARHVVDPVTGQKRNHPHTGRPYVVYDGNEGKPEKGSEIRKNTARNRRLKRNIRPAVSPVVEGTKGIFTAPFDWLRGGKEIRSKKDNSSNRVTGKGFKGKMKDFLFGREIIPETAKNGRKFIKNANGGVRWLPNDGEPVRTGRGILRGRANRTAQNINQSTNQRRTRSTSRRTLRNMINFSDAGMDYEESVQQGKRKHFRNTVKAKVLSNPVTRTIANPIRRIRRNTTLANALNFRDAGMDYQASKKQGGVVHKVRSVKAGVKGFINRSRRSNSISGGNSLATQMLNATPELLQELGIDVPEGKKEKSLTTKQGVANQTISKAKKYKVSEITQSTNTNTTKRDSGKSFRTRMNINSESNGNTTTTKNRTSSKTSRIGNVFDSLKSKAQNVIDLADFTNNRRETSSTDKTKSVSSKNELSKSKKVKSAESKGSVVSRLRNAISSNTTTNDTSTHNKTHKSNNVQSTSNKVSKIDAVKEKLSSFMDLFTGGSSRHVKDENVVDKTSHTQRAKRLVLADTDTQTNTRNKSTTKSNKAVTAFSTAREKLASLTDTFTSANLFNRTKRVEHENSLGKSKSVNAIDDITKSNTVIDSNSKNRSRSSDDSNHVSRARVFSKSDNVTQSNTRSNRRSLSRNKSHSTSQSSSRNSSSMSDTVSNLIDLMDYFDSGSETNHKEKNHSERLNKTSEVTQSKHAESGEKKSRFRRSSQTMESVENLSKETKGSRKLKVGRKPKLSGLLDTVSNVIDIADTVGHEAKNAPKAKGKGFFSKVKGFFRRGTSAVEGVSESAPKSAKGGGFFKNMFSKFKMPKIGSLFGGLAKGVGGFGKVIGGGLLKGLGGVLRFGLGSIFKLGLHAIPFLGWALTAWDIISTIWSNWDAIKSGAQKAWNWIKTTASKVWNWMKTDGVKYLGQFWNWLKTEGGPKLWAGIKSAASGIWNWIKTDGVKYLGQFFSWLVTTAIPTALNWLLTKWFQVWNWIEQEGAKLLGQFWDWLKGKAVEIWDGIKNKVNEAWTWAKNTAMNLWNEFWSWITGIANSTWDGIKNFAVGVWNGIKNTATNLWNEFWGWLTGIASSVWNSISGTAIGLWNTVKNTATSLFNDFWSWLSGIASSTWNTISNWATSTWNSIKNTASSILSTVWDTLKSAATNAFNDVTSWASSTWDGIVSFAKTAFSGMFNGIIDAWNTAKSWVENNPITQTITKVTNNVQKFMSDPIGTLTGSNSDGSHRTGLWRVPKDNYLANLHQGEMVLQRREAQILRDGVGNDGNIAQFLLEKRTDEPNDLQAPKKQLDTSGLRGTKVQVQVNSEKQSSGSQSSDVHFHEGAIKVEVKNASPAEIKKGAKELFNEFKRLMEIENMRNYKPIRGR